MMMILRKCKQVFCPLRINPMQFHGFGVAKWSASCTNFSLLALYNFLPCLIFGLQFFSIILVIVRVYETNMGVPFLNQIQFVFQKSQQLRKVLVFSNDSLFSISIPFFNSTVTFTIWKVLFFLYGNNRKKYQIVARFGWG